jgi:hypothetical protein
MAKEAEAYSFCTTAYTSDSIGTWFLPVTHTAPLGNYLHVVFVGRQLREQEDARRTVETLAGLGLRRDIEWDK